VTGPRPCRQGLSDRFDSVVAELERLPELLLEAKRAFEPRAEELADAWQDEPTT
jgi:fructoselysine-6-phosphate deglycase